MTQTCMFANWTSDQLTLRQLVCGSPEPRPLQRVLKRPVELRSLSSGVWMVKIEKLQIHLHVKDLVVPDWDG